MNVITLLTPKAQVAYLYDDFTIRQGLEKLRIHGYTAIPVLNRDGIYIGTVSEAALNRRFTVCASRSATSPPNTISAPSASVSGPSTVRHSPFFVGSSSLSATVSEPPTLTVPAPERHGTERVKLLRSAVAPAETESDDPSGIPCACLTSNFPALTLVGP